MGISIRQLPFVFLQLCDRAQESMQTLENFLPDNNSAILSTWHSCLIESVHCVIRAALSLRKCTAQLSYVCWLLQVYDLKSHPGKSELSVGPIFHGVPVPRR